MMAGRVVGQVWATRKCPTLAGLRFLLVRPLAAIGDGRGKSEDRIDVGSELVVAADLLGAGDGELVLVAFGRAARTAIGRGHDIEYQSAVVGIIDEVALASGEQLMAFSKQDREKKR